MLSAPELRIREARFRLMLLPPHSSGVETRDGHSKICDLRMTWVPPPGPLIGTMSIGQAEAITIASTSARNNTLSPGADTVGSKVMLPSSD